MDKWTDSYKYISVLKLSQEEVGDLSITSKESNLVTKTLPQRKPQPRHFTTISASYSRVLGCCCWSIYLP